MMMSRVLPAGPWLKQLLLLATVLLASSSLAAKGCVTPPGIPHRLGLGLMNGPQQLSWMTTSGIPWDYRYQYLTGGVNTGDGWTEWNHPYGSFADDYLRDSGNNGYIPVFTYYQIVPSAPDTWSENVSVKLQNASTMRAYFAEWEMLMQKAGAYGRPVIVHVEPDMWGYMEQAYGQNASSVPVSVASSGFPEVAAFPDNASGFANALIHLRNVYAPNVVLGFHVSAWATGTDLTLNDADPYAAADAVFAFYQSLAAPFDLLFFDPSDRDAGFYQAVRGDGGAHWWGESDFWRFREFVGRLVDRTGKKAVLWQVPVGNTLYRSMDNTWGHYQDNRAQYWLGSRQHLQELTDYGVIAILFGAGADGCTMYTDETGDGVTNPAPINGNDLEAQYADDDGGYLRLAASAYYEAGPIPLATP
jgi:hypothetical protein